MAGTANLIQSSESKYLLAERILDKMPPTASDTKDTHRRTWDRAEYANKAQERESKERIEGKARAEAKAEGKKYYGRAPTPEHESEARTQRLDVSKLIGTTQLVPAGAATGKRGRSAGFWCEFCDLTFKDNLQYVEHLNSRQHQQSIGQTGHVGKATLDEVKERLAYLIRKKHEEEEKKVLGNGLDLRKNLERRQENEEREREEKRVKRREKRRKTEGGRGVKQEDEDGVGGGIIC